MKRSAKLIDSMYGHGHMPVIDRESALAAVRQFYIMGRAPGVNSEADAQSLLKKVENFDDGMAWDEADEA